MNIEKKELLDNAETGNSLAAAKEAGAGGYSSQWEGQLSDAIGKILDRKDFTYDMNADALYQQYKDRYVQGGKMAMMDTMGQAAALTGGYGNSYAQAVGQQAYQGYLQGLSDKYPELYKLALDKYDRESEAMYRRYSLLGAQEGRDYERYQMGLDRNQQAWENAFRLYQMGKKTPEVLEILGIPEEEKSGGGGGSGHSGSGGRRNVNLVDEATKIAQGYGTETAYQYIKDQTGGKNVGTMANVARENVKGVAMTEHYKKMAEALKKK